jgi:hypothetical protein
MAPEREVLAASQSPAVFKPPASASGAPSAGRLPAQSVQQPGELPAAGARWTDGFFLQGERVELQIALNPSGIDGGFREPSGLGDNFARYRVRADVYAGYRTDLAPIREVFLYVPFGMMFGDNTPASHATLSARPIAARKSVGIGVTLPRGWKVFAKNALRWHAFDDATIGDGPGGLHAFIYVRSPDFERSFASGIRVAGFGTFALSWPRNEYELNRRPVGSVTSVPSEFGSDFSRYMAYGELRVHHPVNRWRIADAFGIWVPEFHFGRTIPQELYTWEWDYIGARLQFGAGVTFTNGWRLYAAANRWTFSDGGLTGSPDGEYFMLVARLPSFELSGGAR